MTIARIRCDKIDYALPEGKHAGKNLRAFFGVPKSKDLWREDEPDDVVVPESDDEVFVANGARFFTASKKINNS